MSVPMDPIILLSYINTQLRDNYPNLDELCAAMGLDKNDLTKKLAGVNYTYDERANRFI